MGLSPWGTGAQNGAPSMEQGTTHQGQLQHHCDAQGQRQ